MWRVLVTMRQNLQNMGKSPRVADENMMMTSTTQHDHHHHEMVAIRSSSRSQSNWHGFSAICAVLRAPLSLLSCVNNHQRSSRVDGVWVVSSGEFSQVSEMNHLVVSDSMRYALLM